jgi:folate-binding protein YgfZ
MLEPMAHTETHVQPGASDVVRTEYRELHSGCGLVDRSERGKLALTGTGAVEFLNGQVTNELADLRAGEGRYAAFLTHKGKMLGDLRILARDESVSGTPSELLLDTERLALQALFDMIRRCKVGYQVELHKRTLERGLLSLIGPRAETVAGAHDLPPVEHASAALEIGGTSTIAIRTWDGVDVLCEAADTRAIETALIERGATAIGEQVAECVRVERGRPRYGMDMDDGTIPQEAGINDRAVSFTKGCYVGQETVARLHYRGKPNRHLRGVRLSAPALTGDELRTSERTVGRLGSVVLSPSLGPIALALVRREAGPGSVVEVGAAGVTAEVTELPFAQTREAE